MPAIVEPLILGIAGGTGSGKSTIAQKIVDGLSPGMAVVVDHDSYYRDNSELPFEERQLLNYDHPESLDNDLFLEHVDMLRRGQSIKVPIYDFEEHARSDRYRHVESTPIVILEGILVFVDPIIREQMDVKIFVDTASDIRAFRRIRRDMEQRGRSFQHIREQYYKTVRPMHLQFVEPSKRWADIIIPEGGNNTVALDLVVGNLSRMARAVASENNESRLT
jgi:uridine kinase